MRDRLIELIDNATVEKVQYYPSGTPAVMCCEKAVNKSTAIQLADYLLANGVIVPPCKVGDTLYVISQMKDKRILPFINEYEVTSISIKKKSIVIYHEMDGYIKIFKQNDFGKTVFLTKEEAERALKGGEG